MLLILHGLIRVNGVMYFSLSWRHWWPYHRKLPAWGSIVAHSATTVKTLAASTTVLTYNTTVVRTLETSTKPAFSSDQWKYNPARHFRLISWVQFYARSSDMHTRNYTFIVLTDMLHKQPAKANLSSFKIKTTCWNRSMCFAFSVHHSLQTM